MLSKLIISRIFLRYNSMTIRMLGAACFYDLQALVKTMEGAQHLAKIYPKKRKWNLLSIFLYFPFSLVLPYLIWLLAMVKLRMPSRFLSIPVLITLLLVFLFLNPTAVLSCLVLWSCGAMHVSPSEWVSPHGPYVAQGAADKEQSSYASWGTAVGLWTNVSVIFNETYWISSSANNREWKPEIWRLNHPLKHRLCKSFQIPGLGFHVWRFSREEVLSSLLSLL